jgi:hypothetical protein
MKTIFRTPRVHRIAGMKRILPRIRREGVDPVLVPGGLSTERGPEPAREQGVPGRPLKDSQKNPDRAVLGLLRRGSAGDEAFVRGPERARPEDSRRERAAPGIQTPVPPSFS